MPDIESDSTIAEIIRRIEELSSILRKYNSRESLLLQDNGWTKEDQIWTYASATTFTITGTTDMSLRFPVGTKLRLKQGGAYKYFYTVSAVFTPVTGPTTVTITGGSDYSLVNAAITNNYFSYQENPQGFPQWFNYAPTYDGFSIDPGLNPRFSIRARMVTITSTGPLMGTSDDTIFTMTAPIASPNDLLQVTHGIITLVYDNGAVQSTPGSIRLMPGVDVMDLYTDFNSGAWTNSSGKGAKFTFSYRI